MTVVVNSGSTTVVVTTLVLAATVAAVLIAELIAVLGDSGRFSGCGSSGYGSGHDSGRAGQVAVMIRKGITHSEKASEFFMHS